jgi:DNA-binding SARP family transcriptional activator
MSILHIQLLGNFRLTYGDSVLTTISAQRMQALLAYLLLHADAPQSRQHLAFLLWPASSESQARSNLRKLLYQLRQALPDPDRFLCYNNATVQWKPDAPYTTDVGELEQLLKELVHEKLNLSLLTRLVEQYCGELLPDCYEDWVVPRRQYYQRSVEDALERLVTLLENQRAYAKGARYAQRLLELDPLEESRYQRLMRLRAFRGDRAGALHVYYDCVRVLERELGVKPGPATQQLYEKILNVTLSPPAQAAGQSTLAATISLVGRTAEWQQLCVARQKAVQGRPHLVAITGEAGIGKTRLAEELLVWASRQGILHARTHAYAAQGDLAYAPITELLRVSPNSAIFGWPKLHESCQSC